MYNKESWKKTIVEPLCVKFLAVAYALFYFNENNLFKIFMSDTELCFNVLLYFATTNKCDNMKTNRGL